jgi:succinyl-diaminopimelate desuccinylase
MISALELLRDILRCPSVTPNQAGTLDLLAPLLQNAGFTVERIDRNETSNLWAYRGEAPYFVINGHVDVVPPGEGWSGDPFEPREIDGLLIGRGACDMKASVAVAVVALIMSDATGVGLLLTSDEEGPGFDGTEYALTQIPAVRAGLVVEPTSTQELGDFYKPGRRGSVTAHITVPGIQGHVAYPSLAKNAVHTLAPILDELVKTRWDDGDEYFPPTSMQVFHLKAGVGASNVIPGEVAIGINWRNSPASPFASIKARTEMIAKDCEIVWQDGARPFLSPPAAVAGAIQNAVEAVTGRHPAPSTSGGTSDARAFAALGIEVAEFGPVPVRMHGADEGIKIADLEPLVAIYRRILESV